jgi:hypothetical protein
MERAMGIENTTRETVILENQRVMNSPGRRVRFLCEKQRYTSHRQPAPALVTKVDGVIWALTTASQIYAFTRILGTSYGIKRC